jgi:hypothetical protein
VCSDFGAEYGNVIPVDFISSSNKTGIHNTTPKISATMIVPHMVHTTKGVHDDGSSYGMSWFKHLERTTNLTHIDNY